MAFQVEASLLSVSIVLEGWPFGPKLFISFLSKERFMAQKCYWEMGNFWSTCPKASIKDDSKASRFWGLHSWSSRGFWQAWSCSKSWCIPNYQLLVSFKNSSFFVAWFSKNSRNKFLNQEFYGQLPEQAWSKGSFVFFQNCAPWGTNVFFFRRFHSEKECLLRLPTMTTNFFENPITKNLETFFLSFFLRWLYDHDIYSPFWKCQQNL